MHTLPATKLGLDGLNITIPAANATAKEVAFNLFNIPLAKWHKVPSTLAWYETAYQLLSTEYTPGKPGAVLAMLYTDYRITTGKGKHSGSHHHIQIKGHALASSALNPFNSTALYTLPDKKHVSLADAVPATAKPLTVSHILQFTVQYKAKITELHVYLDLLGFDVPFDSLVKWATEENFQDYFRSTFLRKCKHQVRNPATKELITQYGIPPLLPYPPGKPNGLYIGRYGHSYSQIYAYSKHEDPAHRINDQDQLLKYTWHRVEVRLRGQVGHRAGKWLLSRFSSDSASIDKSILQLVVDHIAFTMPEDQAKRGKPLQDWWLQAVNMATQSEQAPT